MTYRDLPYYKDIRAKAHCEYKLNTKIMQTVYITLENSWSQFVLLNVG